jgi:hypothetical protein
VIQLANGSGRRLNDGWLGYYGQTAATAVVMASQSASTAPGLPNCVSLKATTALALGANDSAAIYTLIEGNRLARCSLGSAGASAITIGFWAFATVPGVMCVMLRNPSASRGYPVDVPINNAATWEYKTVTFPGDTVGPWGAGVAAGALVYFTLAAGSGIRGFVPNAWQNATASAGTANTTNFFAANNNLVSITGLIILPGNAAPSAARSPFIMRPFDQELDLCRRYYEKSYPYAVLPGSASSGLGAFSTPALGSAVSYSRGFYVPKRAAATVTIYSPNTGAPGKAVDSGGTSPDVAATVTGPSEMGFGMVATLVSVNNSNCNFHYVADARF